MEFDIFGSCLSRDGFEFESNSHKVNQYFSRSSLVSILQPPLSKIDVKIDLESNFLKRTVKDDLTKRFKHYINNPRSKVIIIDLIQERYPLVQLEKSWFTYSADYRRAKLPKGTMIKGNDQLEMYKKNIENIAALFQKYEYVILHEANLAEVYYNNEGDLESFKLYEKDNFFIENGKEYYSLLKENLPNVYSLSLNGFKGTGDHKWGAAPSHYENEYYEKYNEGLDYIVENKKDYSYNHSE